MAKSCVILFCFLSLSLVVKGAADTTKSGTDGGRTAKTVPAPLHAINAPAEEAGRIRLPDELDLKKMAATDCAELRFHRDHVLQVEKGLSPGLRIPIEGICVIQFPERILKEWHDALEAIGVTIHGYVKNHAYLVDVPSSASEELLELFDSGVIRYIGPLPAEAKLRGELSVLFRDPSRTEIPVTVILFRPATEEERKAVQSQMKVEHWSDTPPFTFARGTSRSDNLLTLASLPVVRWIERTDHGRPQNIEGRMSGGGDYVAAVAGYDGSGVRVAVDDTGIAHTGDAAQCGASGAGYHPDLGPGRILDEYDYWNMDPNPCDEEGHGTHVAGTIGGDGTNDILRSGVAPGVDLLIYKDCCDSEGMGFVNFASVTGRAAEHDADIISNSWGGNDKSYNWAASIADEVVRGGWPGSDGNPQYMFMSFSAGNSCDLVGAPALGKNVIAVGAMKDGNWPDDGPHVYSCCSDDFWPPTDKICFSCTGPVDVDGDGHTQVKPDLMAPGTRIRSTVPPYLSGGLMYDHKDGTSMAQPMAAATVALMYEAHPTYKNWPEMYKARLLATAVDLGPKSDYGHGMIDAVNAVGLSPSLSHALWAGNHIDATNEEKSHPFIVPVGFQEVRVYLTWPDVPAGGVVNDLDLRVYDGTDTVVASSYTSDDTVEYVRVTTGAPGTWRAAVKGYNVPQPSQSYGIAGVVVINPPSLAASASPSTTCLQPGEAFDIPVTLSNSGYSAAASQVELDLPNDPTVFIVDSVSMFTEEGFEVVYTNHHWINAATNQHYLATGLVNDLVPRHATWHLHAGNSVPDGTYTITVRGHADQTASVFTTKTFHVDTTAPGDAAGLSSASHVKNTCSKDLDVTMSWLTAPDGEGCGIDGYGIGWSLNAPSLPGKIKDLEEVNSYTETLAESNDPYYFNLRAVDNAGLWADTWASWGPFTLDATPPGDVTDLGSSSHALNSCSNVTAVTMTWTAAPDDNCGIDGYSISWSQGAPSDPGETKDIEEVTAYEQTLAPSATPYYFNICSLDNAGNWANTYVSWGPIRIDTAAPAAVTNLDSPSHPLNSCSVSTDVTMTWIPASDDNCGIDGYSVEWSTIGPSWPDNVKDIGSVTSHAATLTPSPQPYYFSIRAVDKAGNWSANKTDFGPIYISAMNAAWTSGSPVCEGNSMSFTGPEGYANYTWEFNDGCRYGVTINEIQVGDPDAVEIVNSSNHAVNLNGWTLAWTDTNLTSGTIALPEFILAPGGYVQLMDACGPGSDGTHIIFCDDLPWDQARGGSLSLIDSSTSAVDFVRWGGDATAPPSGTSWSEVSPLATPANTGQALSRDDSGTDTDKAADWCIQPPTAVAFGQPLRNADCPSVAECAYGGCSYGPVINEIFAGPTAAAEIFNTGPDPVDLTNWSFCWSDTDSGNRICSGPPSQTLAPGGYLLLIEGWGSPDSTHYYLGLDIPWDPAWGGSAELLTPAGRGIDFVRWGGEIRSPTAGTSWTEPSALPTPGASQSLARNTSGMDRGSSEDWCLQAPSSAPVDPGPNTNCVVEPPACPIELQRETSHHFSGAGEYSVSLTVTDDSCCTDTVTGMVTVGPALTAIPASGLNPAVLGRTVPFTANISGGTPPFVFLWNFGDSQSSSLQDPVHEYASAGPFNVSLEMSDAVGCIFRDTGFVQQIALPVDEPSDVDLHPADPPLRVLSGNQIVVEEVPLALDYHIYGNVIGNWPGQVEPLGYCATAHSSNGDGTVLINFAIPDNFWIVVAAADDLTESSLGRNSEGQERNMAGRNGTIGDDDEEAVSGWRCGPEQ